MSTLNDIYIFLEDYSGTHPTSPDVDIFKDLKIWGDDFDELIHRYSKEYNVDMNDYLWYFHNNEENYWHNLGSLFHKPPYNLVNRIPITPQMLCDFAKAKKWNIKYPQHTIPEVRKDLTINRNCIIAILLALTGGVIHNIVWITWHLLN